MSGYFSETWKQAHGTGGQDLVDLIRNDTHTCYRGEREELHDWGYGCGTCPACDIRRAGYEKWTSRTPKYETVDAQ